MKTYNTTKSICPICQKVIPADVFEQEGRMFIKSKCDKHGENIEEHVWDDPEIYEGMLNMKLNEGISLQVIVDTTFKCNLNCKVCFAKANEININDFVKEDLLRLKGAKHVFFSGGEPTMNEDLPEMMKFCVKNKMKPILFTNGIKLADFQYAKKLKEAGLRSVLLQMDTLREEDCDYIRGRRLVAIKIKALRNLRKLNIPVASWTVVVKNRNLKDLKKIYDFVFKFPNVKTVSAIPIWKIGRFEEGDFVPSSTIIKELGEIYDISKSDFIATTQLLCNLDRFIQLFEKNRGRLFGKCMLKGLIADIDGDYISITKILNIDKINQKLEILFKERVKIWGLAKFFGYFLKDEVLINFLKNKPFRKVCLRFFSNLRFIPSKRYLLINPFRFITVGIFPNPKNIDLEFIKDCNSYALSCDDYSLTPACLHYIETGKKH